MDSPKIALFCRNCAKNNVWGDLDTDTDDHAEGLSLYGTASLLPASPWDENMNHWQGFDSFHEYFTG